MSSFVIDKKMYTRCAGAIIKLRKVERDYMILWNHKENREMTDEEILKDFENLYKYNTLSVAIQYKDIDMMGSSDGDLENDSLYGSAMVAYFGAQKMSKYIIKFFDSIRYQIEDKEIARKVSDILNYYTVKIASLLTKEIDGAWGSFEKEDLE